MRIKEEHIIISEGNLIRAIKDGDVETLEKVLHDDLLFITPDGSAITKKMDLDAHRSGSMSVIGITASIESIHIIDETAIVTQHVETNGTMLGQSISGSFRYLRVWKQVGDSLQVIAGACVKL